MFSEEQAPLSLPKQLHQDEQKQLLPWFSLIPKLFLKTLLERFDIVLREAGFGRIPC